MAEAEDLVTTCSLSLSKILHAQCALVSSGRMSISSGTKDMAVLVHFNWPERGIMWTAEECVSMITVLVGSDRYDQHGEPSPII